MPPVIAAVVAIGSAAAAAVGVVGLTGAAAFAVGAAVIVGGTMLVTKLATPDINQGVADNDGSRQITSRGTVESQKIVYGQALVSGPIAFVGVSGAGNKNLHHVIALAGHQVEAITEVWLDDQVITSAQIAGTNWVSSGTFAPISGDNVVKINRYLGTSTQSADADLVSAFTGYTTSHKGLDKAYIATTFVLTDGSQELWDKYKPSNIKALVQGRNEIYDPRLDVTPGASPANASYQAYTDNPALCVIDYLLNTTFGMKIAPAKIDWAAVVTAANACDVSVAIPTGATQKRFTANGVLFTTDKHQTSINKILSSMNGTLVYTSGTYVVRAGVYEAPTESLGEDDLAGPISVKTSVERSDRFNTCGGVFIDPAKQHKSVEFPKIQLTAALNRDNGEALEREIDLPFTNSSYMAQRIANKLVQLSDQQKIISFPCNLSGLRIAVGDRVNVTISDFGWSNKVFRCMAWAFSDSGGVDLTLAEDDAGSYADPTEAEYTTVLPDGVIVDGFPGVPDPSLLAAAAGIQSIDLNWTNPANTTKFSGVILYASPTSAWSGAVEIGRGMLTSFKHDASTTADPITNGATRFYWVRAIGLAASGSVLSDRNPDNDTSTITATAALNQAQLVEWSVVADSSGLRPENNATIGARLSANATTNGNITTAAGVQLTDDAVLNTVVIADITQIQLAGTGEILELVNGEVADLQQLGDVASYAFNADTFLQGEILDVETSVVNLGSLLGDITAGVGDVYVQAAAPVAGVGGVPDPIVISSRWYDSDDSNAPYYWSGSAWVSLADPRIASNKASITGLTATLATTQTTVAGQTTSIAANASAISVLDTTVTALDGTVTTLSGSYNQFVAAYDALDPSSEIAANSSAIGAIDVRVTAAEGSITTSATDITSLSSSIQNYNILEDVGGSPLEFVGGGEIELQDASAVGGSVGTAVSVLDTRATETERVQSVQSSSIVALTGSLANTNANVAGNVAAVSGLTVAVEAQGAIITANAADVTALEVSLAAETSTRASADSALDVRVTSAEGVNTAQSALIVGLQSELDDSQLDITANAAANSALTTRVTDAEGSITSQAGLITGLTSSLGTTDANVTANAAATTALTTRVTAAEGVNTSQSGLIATLTSDLGTADTGISANAAATTALTTRVTATESVNSSQALSLTNLQSELDDSQLDISANSTATNALGTRVTTAEGSITSQAGLITGLQSELDNSQLDITANAAATTALTTRVTSTEGVSTAQAAQLTDLSASLGTTIGNVQGNADAITGLSTRVTDAEGAITASSTDVTSLASSIQTYNVLEDVSGSPLQFIGGAEIELQDASAVGASNGTAVAILDTRATETERVQSVQSSDIVALTASLANTNTNVAGNAAAVSGLTVIVEAQGTSIAAGASDITTLEATLDTEADTRAAADSALDVRVSSNEVESIAQSALITGLQSELDNSQLDITANASATTALTTRVTSTEAVNSTQSASITSQAGLITGLQSELDNSQLDITANASATTALTTRVTSTEAVNSTQSASITSQAGLITGLQSELDNSQLDITANASATTALTTRVTSAEGSITSQSTSISDLTASLASTNTTVSSVAAANTATNVRVSSAEGSITSQATTISGLSTTVGNNSASITTQASSINGIEARYSIVLDVDGNITGVELIGGTGGLGTLKISANAEISGNLLVAGTVTTGGLAANAATFAPNETDVSSRSYTGTGAKLVQTLTTFASDGYPAEFLAELRFAGGGIAPTVELKLNGVALATRLAFGGQSLIVVGGNTIDGNNTLTLHFNAASNATPGGETSTAYSSYLRVLEFRR